MTDRELLEMAAKAAGIAVVWGKWLNRHEWLVHYNTGDLSPWNPLTDDGDALRLAVKLGLRVYTPDDGDDIAVVRNYSGLHVQEMGEDHNKITRRAIVRAAAEIGRGME